MPRNNKLTTLVLDENTKMTITVETAKAIKIEITMDDRTDEEWMPKSQITYLHLNAEDSEPLEYHAEHLHNQETLNIKDLTINTITYKDWLTFNKVALLRLVEYFDGILTTFHKNMRDASQFWEGGRFSYCQICGRTLIHETSVEHGIGPVCADHLAQAYEREQAQAMMDAYRMVYEGQFDGLDPNLPIWVGYRFRRIGRKTNTTIKDDKTIVDELASMYQHSVRGKVSHLKWEIITSHNQREPTWVTVQKAAKAAREAEKAAQEGEIIIE